MEAYLYDINFLKQLDYHREKNTYARITLLTADNLPKEYIEGVVTGGSINVDGASAVRRSCSLNLLVSNEQLEDPNSYINDKYWSYNHTFKLEIGLKNTIEPKYPDIVWFNQGTYIISSFSISKSTQSISVSIQGKDKMCRLNGEISGNIPIETDFGTIEYENEEGKTLIEKLPLYTIIQQAVREYGGERLENIVIKDLDASAYELWEYMGETPMYLIIKADDKTILGISFDGDIEIGDNKGTFSNFAGKYYSFNTLDKNYNNNATSFKFYGEVNCYLAKIEYGETAGYHITPLVYNSDLILRAGEAVTSLLDKIKNMLGNFEYFYDLNGRFIFQKKKTYVNEIFSPINGNMILPTMTTSSYSYKFEDVELFTAISSPPNIGNIKNDYTVWGTKKSASGADLPIHVRYAIAKKPKQYVSPYTTHGPDASNEYMDTEYDWRELIYIMAKDNIEHNSEPDFFFKLQGLNPWCQQGKTGYEQYYSDMLGFWRQLYNPNPSEQDIEKYGEFYDVNGSDGKGTNKYWTKKIHSDPNSLLFWFDFLDLRGEISNYNINKIGLRTKVVNENSVKSIYYKETPEIVFVIPGKDDDYVIPNSSYSKMQIQENLEEFFMRSAQGLSAISKVNDLIYEHTFQTSNLSITSIPIYYLEPNTRIYVEGYGDYILNKITYSLNYNGTMNINGVKINEQF